MTRRRILGAIAALVAVLGFVPEPAAAAPTAGDDVRLIVTFRRGTPAATQRQAAAGEGAVVDGIDVLRTRTITVPAAREKAARVRLARRPDVVAVERDLELAATLVPNDPSWSGQWGPARVQLPGAWDVSTGASDVVIAVIDTGVRPTSPELPSSRLTAGYNAITFGGSSNADDDNGHGTMAASVAAMTGNNGSRAAGACWSCRIMPVKVLRSTGSGSTSDVAEGIVWAVDHGADVLSLSLSGGGTSTLQSAVNYAESRGVLVVAAAGNSASTSPVYPAGYGTVVSVGATDQSDGRASYSNSGSWVHIAAPGTNYAVNRSGSLVSFSGTSSATPLVSGTAGLLEAIAPTASLTQIRAALYETADPAQIVTSSGRLDAAAAVARFGTPSPTTSTTSTSTSTTTTSTSTTTTSTSTTTTSTSTTTTTTTQPLGGTPTTVTVTANSTRSTPASYGAPAKPGPITFVSDCGCFSQNVSVLGPNGQVLGTASGGSRVTLNVTTTQTGTHTFRSDTRRAQSVQMTITTLR